MALNYEEELAKPNTVIFGSYRVISRNEQRDTVQISYNGRTYHATTDSTRWFWVALDGTRFQK